jgi:hypothetical protein
LNLYLQLKPCPFCGDNQILALEYSLICLNCGAKGPRAIDEEQAIAFWEGRSQMVNKNAKALKPDDALDIKLQGD